MKNYYYLNYNVCFTPSYSLANFIDEHELGDAEIVQMFQEDKVNPYRYKHDLHYEYLIIFKIPAMSRLEKLRLKVKVIKYNLKKRFKKTRK